MVELTILELYVLLTVLEKAHAQRLKTLSPEQNRNNNDAELEREIIAKLRHIRHKHRVFTDTIVLREVRDDTHPRARKRTRRTQGRRWYADYRNKG